MNNKELQKIRAKKAEEKAAMTKEDTLYAKKIRRQIRNKELPRYMFTTVTDKKGRKVLPKGRVILTSVFHALTKKD